MVDLILDKLKVFEDEEFKFDPVWHKYTYKGQPFISVTQFIQLFHEKFDTEYWSKYKSEQLGKPQEEILKERKQLNDRANEIGSATHNWIENYFNRIYQELPTDIDVIDRINKFNIAYAKYLYKLKPIAFEVRIFSKKWKIAGTIDALFLYKDKIYIIDYKTNKKFTTDGDLEYRDFLLPPFDKFYKTHLNEYSIQISLYTLILREHGFNISGGYLVHIGPDDEAKIHKCVDFTQILKKYLDEYLIG